MSRLQVQGDEWVLLHISHSNMKSFAADVRFSLQGKICSSHGGPCIRKSHHGLVNLVLRAHVTCPDIISKTATASLKLGDDVVPLQIDLAKGKRRLGGISALAQMTVEAVKEKLWKKCGTSVNSMCLELYDDSSAKISDLSDNMRPLGFYSPQDGYRLHVIDIDPSSVTSGGWLEDTSLVEKYTISEEAYDKLDGTYRKFKEKYVHQNPDTHVCKMSENYMEDLCVNIKVGDRCQVDPGEKRGVIKFVGRAETLGPGFWVGIQYDEPLGKHDGMVKGMRYFDCPPLHGAMMRPDKVKVGDYPERDPFEEEEI